MCVAAPNLVAIGQTVAKIRRFFDFQNGGSPPSFPATGVRETIHELHSCSMREYFTSVNWWRASVGLMRWSRHVTQVRRIVSHARRGRCPRPPNTMQCVCSWHSRTTPVKYNWNWTCVAKPSVSLARPARERARKTQGLLDQSLPNFYQT